MDDEIKIESLTEPDIEETGTLFQTVLNDTFSNTFPDEAIVKYKNDWGREEIRQAVAQQDKLMIVAKSNQKIVGLLFGSPLNGGLGTIIWVAVSTELRGKGIGKLLCMRAEMEYKDRGAHKIVLYTETDSAKRFYQRIGYVLEGTHPGHWWGVDHYCLTKRL